MSKKLLILAVCLVFLLVGCGGKHSSNKKEEAAFDQDLFVEYDDAYFAKYGERLRAAEYSTRYRKFLKTVPRENFISWSNKNAASKGLHPGARRKLLRAAHSAIGTPYVVGGTSPGGFDCSGLVCWAYGNVGVKLPRTAREQSVVGRKIMRVEDMQAGDIVAFKHPRRGYHTGIYVGDGKFIHSPRRKSHVKINSLDDPYFSSTFLSARRISLTGREDLLAQAEQRLQDDNSYEVSKRRFKREEHRTSRNASRGKKIREYSVFAEKKSRHSLHKELVERRKGKGKYREEIDVREKKGKTSRLVADKERSVKSKTSSKREMREEKEISSKKKADVREKKRDKGRERAEVKNSREEKKGKRAQKEQASRKKQETAYDNDRGKKTNKADKKKRNSRNS